MRFSSMLGGLIVLVFTGHSNVFAHSPADFLEVVEVEPARIIEHSVELKTEFDSRRMNTKLAGPYFYSQVVGAMGRAPQKLKAYLNWYKIVPDRDLQEVKNPGREIRQVEVLDVVRGGTNKSLRIGRAEYLLSPAQRMMSGIPDDIPDGLDHYKAYRVVDATDVDLVVETLNVSDSKSAKRKLGRPVFVCLPTTQWHHDEHIEATHPKDGFVVYEMDQQFNSVTYSTIDQFGLNELRGKSSKWLAVRAAVLDLAVLESAASKN